MSAAKKQGKPNSFTFYDGFAECVELLPSNSAKAAFVYDFYNFGAWGIEPTFSWAKDEAVKMACEMAWKVATHSIEKNIASRKAGKKGGRPKKKKEEIPTFIDDSIPDAVIDALAMNAEMPVYEEVF